MLNLPLPVRVLQGAVPYRDFELFYGPANTYVVAGAFELFGFQPMYPLLKLGKRKPRSVSSFESSS